MILIRSLYLLYMKKVLFLKKHKIPTPDVSILAALFIILLCIEAAIGAYEEVYKATPDYSFKQLVVAVQQEDSEKTNALTDSKNIAAQIFDTLSANVSGIDSFPILRTAWAPLRTDFIDDSSRLVTLSLQPQANGLERKGMEDSLKACLQALNAPIPLTGWHYAGHEFAHKTDSTHAEMDITLYNDELQAYIPCRIQFTRISPHVWQVSGLADPKAFIDHIDTARSQALATYNASLQQQIDALVTLKNTSATLIHSDGQQTFLRLTYTPVITGNTGIQEIHGLYELQRDADKAILYSGTIHLSPVISNQAHTSQFLLNPMIPSQYALITRTNLDGTHSHLRITGITRADGSTLQLADKVPH